MELEEEFELYRKLEILLFRYFKIKEFIEFSMKFNIKLTSDYSEILDPKGFDNCQGRTMCEGIKSGYIYIPFNPFFLNEDEKKIFLQIFPDKYWEWENDFYDNKRKLLEEIWKRIHEIKWWLGITIDTRYCGIRKESRLVTQLEHYLETGIKKFRYEFEHAIFRNVPNETIKRFIEFCKDRRRKEGIIWTK